jgi:hypothetical protein
MRLLTCSLLLVAGAALAQAPCQAPGNAQFDFWIGEWDVHAGGKLVGHNTITRAHGGCTVREEYAAVGSPFVGSSFNWYDALADRWHQVWVDNGGTRLDLVGGLEDGAMVLAGDRATARGAVRDRITWTPAQDGTVRQLWEQSRDGGDTWGVAFDGTYRKADR